MAGAGTDPAVVARNALVAADSLSLTGGGPCGDVLATVLDDTHVTLDDGRVVLAVPPCTPLAGARLARRRDAAGPGAPVALHVTDLAPLPVRDRVRARVTVLGHLGPVDAAAVGDADMAALRPLIGDVGELWVLSPDQVLVSTRARLVALQPDVWRSARADALAGREAPCLADVAGDRELIDALAARIPREILAASTRVLPLAVDSRGIVIRAERPEGHADVRLPFRDEISSPVDVRQAVVDMLTRDSDNDDGTVVTADHPVGDPGSENS